MLLSGAEAAKLNGIVAQDDPSRARLDGAHVRLRAAGSTTSVWTRSGADGSFHFEHMAPGRYEIRALLSEYQPGTRTIEITASDEVSEAFVLLKLDARSCYGPELYGTAATLSPAADTSGSLAGVVRDGSHPLKKVDVNLTPDSGASRTEHATTDKRGRFSFSGLPPGDYRIDFQEPLHVTGWAEAEVRRGSDSTVEIHMSGVPGSKKKDPLICR